MKKRFPLSGILVFLWLLMGCQASPTALQKEDTTQPFIQQQKEVVKNRLEALNQKPYRIVEITFPAVHVLNVDQAFTQVEADVVMEKGGHYDWMRVKCELDHHQLLSMSRIPIDYEKEIQGSKEMPEPAKEAVKKAMQSLKTDDRSWFGIDKQDHELVSKGIQDIQVLQIQPVGMSEDQQEVLTRIKVQVKTYQQTKVGEFLVFLRQYEQKKWQVEEMHRLGSPTK
jgi:hypothetical protein